MLLVVVTNATPDPTTLQTLPNDVGHIICRHVDHISQAQFAFSHPSIYVRSRVVLLPNLMDALFNYITPDLLLNELITILCQQSLYNTVLMTLFRQATDQQIVGLYDRLHNRALVQKLYASVKDAEFRQLIKALR